MGKCKADNCSKYSSFGITKAEYCGTHKLDNMYNISKCCVFTGCIRHATFGFIEKKLYCKYHKLEDMKYLVKRHDICKHDECSKRAIFGFADDNKKIYCRDHKLANMIDFTIKYKLCKYPKCKIYASCGITKKDYCTEHKLEHMKFIGVRKCRNVICDLAPSFGYENDKIPLYCSKHKLENMINLHKKLCKYNNCIVQPSFGFIGKSRLYCSKHKLKNMVHLT
jgi:hypothetical protein